MLIFQIYLLPDHCKILMFNKALQKTFFQHWKKHASFCLNSVQ